MSDHLKIARRFVKEQRDELPAEESNYFGSVFGDVLLYLEFLEVILARYYKLNSPIVKDFREYSKRIKEEPSGKSRSLTADEVKRMYSRGAEQRRLQLEIETFFLFLNILLDRVAAATEYYFGRGKEQWKSFTTMQNHLAEYAKNRSLTDPGKLIEHIAWLSQNASVVRHKFQAHKLDNDYTIRIRFGIGFDASDETFLAPMLLYPKNDEKFDLTIERPSVIYAQLSRFIDIWTKYLRENKKYRELEPPP